LDPLDLARILLQLCRGLAFLHDRGVLHGDLKPQNLRLATGAMGERIARMAEDPALGHPEGMDFRGLENARQQWATVAATLDDWQRRLTARSVSLAEWRRTAGRFIETWRLTIEALEAAGITGAIRDTAGDVQRAWRQADERLKARQQEVLSTQGQLTGQAEVVQQQLEAIDRVRAQARLSVLSADYQPLWKGTGALEGQRRLPSIGQRVATDVALARDYVRGEGAAVSVHVLLTFLALAVFVSVRKRVSRLAEEREDLRRSLSIFRRPVAAALALSLMVAPWVYPDAPIAFREAVGVLGMVPLVWLLPLVIAPSMRRPVYLAVGLFLLVRLTDLLSSGTAVGRLVLLAYAAGAGVIAWWIFRPGGRATTVAGGRYWGAARIAGRVGALAFFASAVLNVLGFVSLADLLADGTLRSAIIGLWVFLSVAVIEGVTAALLFSPLLRVLNMARWNSALVLNRIVRLAGLLAVVFWLLGTLQGFRLLEPAGALAHGIFTASATIGAVSISLGDITAFVLALVVGLYLARLLRFVLTVEVFPRVTLPRGVPATIVMLVNYSVLGLAFVFAVAAAGIDLSNFAIIAGALSVGIGFGLQNVVNNFVSGLILAFERPVQAGDAVQFGDMWGRVTRIGVRSSTVRTWSGAEVIVPNGDLISSQVTNWTLSDQQRRMEIPVGVAYGSDPHRVLDLLVGCARKNTRLLQSPEPNALFLGFGSSSLDFELRAWTDDFDNFLAIKSELTLAIHDALYAEGIEIPFPQQDLHLRTVSEQVLHSLARPPPSQQD
ncbi:mechanosensitive ion channel domain-containing protein, partial [Pseudoxanthomonas mexicana]|uniref:mechanosensitive ion channel domain-containing protein n=1 Tax=Pseudoxanthomonas mexicana TaxID=128785 RepID=UPI0024E1E469